ncbi:OmpA family protein [Hymenobacter gummosus]|uniref:OmpA family protein n=1 Tax=Hymenobacter gummosus TaxID=1776032 RepID=A0A3S0QES0_9BACT|nr:OmpA family protein [Hymenobacter gummosus]RTQ45815.1 OmpA family protein [Hymenobacter gummosus]
MTFTLVSALRRLGLLLGTSAALLACSSESKPAEEAAAAPVVPTAAAPKPAEPAAPAPAPAEAAAPPAAAGFDAAAVPVANPTVGAFPFFSLIDGYEKGDAKGNMMSTESKNLLKDVAFDRYEFFDGVKIIPVEGRLYTTKALGEGASFFQAQKTYEKLIKDMGGVTVWEGSMQKFKDAKLNFEEQRHRGRYNMWDSEKAGVYMVRTPDREIWVEAYKQWDDKDNYWLTVVEKKALPMQAAVLPAEQLKKELDANGHVAVYINFDTDKASIKPESEPAVAQVLKLLQTTPALRLTVEGHTDNAGTAAHNQQLSEQRAQAVVAALTSQGVAATRLKPAGLGQTKPLADNGSEEGKAKNRRVELVRM